MDAPQVCMLYDSVLNKDLKEQGTVSGLSVSSLKTSSNSPKWTDLYKRKQNLRVSVKSNSNRYRSNVKMTGCKLGNSKLGNKTKEHRQKSFKQQQKEFAEKEKRDMEGMSSAQRFQYLQMGLKEREEFIKNIREEKEKIRKDNENKAKEKYKQEVKIDDACVLVLNMRGKPLMPCSPAKARILLKEGKAKVVERCPFNIQLKYSTGESKQDMDLGFDTGFKHVGFSVTTDKKEVLAGEVMLRTDIPERLDEKSTYRRNRRGRNTRYREARFDNRVKSKPEGWLAPSIQHKLDTYVMMVEKIGKGLPITGITLEVSPFDTQKMQNPEMSGIEYQQGTLKGYEVREYLLEKWGRKCAYCGKQNIPFETEHIIPPSRIGLGGSNRISNLTIACHDCNQKKGNMTATEFGHPEVQALAQKSMKDAAFMNIVRAKLVGILREKFPNYEINSIYGYMTKYWRIKSGIDKSHANDAFVISTIGNKSKLEKINKIIRSKPYQVKQTRRNDRSLQTNRKGYRPSIRRQRYKFKPGDLVVKRTSIQPSIWSDKVNRRNIQVYIVKGVFNYGKSIRLINPIIGEDDININIKEVKLLKYGAGLLFQLPDNKKEKGEKDKVIEKKVKKLSKKEQKIIDMKMQKSIDDAWN